MSERIDVDAAFDPGLRAAQADMDRYLLSRPTGIIVDDSKNVYQIEVSLPLDIKEESGDELPVAVRGLADITKSFDKSVVPLRARSRPDKIGMVLDDIRDNKAWVKPPYATVYQGPGAEKLLEQLLPEDTASAFRRLGQHYEDGHMYRRIIHVGNREDGTFHPHFYFMDRTRAGVTRVYFVDPEHKVASKNLLRPSIANLVGIEVPDNEIEAPSVTIMRCLIPEYDYENKPDGLRPEELRKVIEQALDRNGDLPDRFAGGSERRVLFMIAANSQATRVQARYSTKKQIESFARGGRGSRALDGKLWVQGYVVDKLIKLFNQRSEAREVA